MKSRRESEERDKHDESTSAGTALTDTRDGARRVVQNHSDRSVTAPTVSRGVFVELQPLQLGPC